jgi:hypothetical protein
LEARFAVVEGAAEGSVVLEKRFGDFCMKLIGDLTPLREVYERNIQSHGGICSPIPSAAPSVKDYIPWLTSEVVCLPEVFVIVSVNENFISVAIEGLLAMALGGGG